MSRPSTSFLGNKTRTWITGTSPVMTTSRCPDHPLSVMAGRRDEAIHLRCGHAEPWIASLSLAKTMMEHSDLRRLCEERSDEAIHLRSCDAEPWIASRSLSSGAHSRDPVARNDGSNHPAPGLRF